MYKKMSTEDYFQLIKKNHKASLATNISVSIESGAQKNSTARLSRYLSYIRDYQTFIQTELDEAVKSMSTGEIIEKGTLSALFGIGVSALAFIMQQKTPSADIFGAKALTQAGFAATLGASSSVLIYEAWRKSNEKPLSANLESTKADMRKAGFTDEKYNELSENLIKLFHYRECLLNGPMREAFKSRYYTKDNATDYNEVNFNKAIEVYFLEQLNLFFKKTFQSIYTLHDKEIQDEKDTPDFIRFFKKHFKTEENQQRFTQQMQLEFIIQCIHFLQKEMNAPGFLGKRTYLIDALIGLIIASLAVGFFAINILFIPVFGLVSIGLVAGSLAAVCSHLTIVNHEFLYYKRDKANREAIKSVIQKISNEHKRLSSLTQTVVATTHKELNDLKIYDHPERSSFLKLLQIKKTKHVALGSVKGWIREFANRFKESKFIEIDLSERIKSIINDAHEQTELLENILSRLTASAPHAKSTDSTDLHELRSLIEDTTHYLRGKEEQDFIKAFECVQKIKEQVLEAVSGIPTSHTKPLPSLLIQFYTRPLSEGGLGGLKSDLEQARTMAPIVSLSLPTDEHHPYHRFLNTAFTMDLKLNSTQDPARILQGDPSYRRMLGLPSAQTLHGEHQITSSNIQCYLTASFCFLCSLNDYTGGHTSWEEPFQNHDEFVLYRMLLMKQLASWVDPSHSTLDSLTIEEVKTFAKEKLNCNPDIAFDDILSQALLMNPNDGDTFIQDTLSNSHKITELSSVADAIRLDIAYGSSRLSPKQLAGLAAHDFLKINEGNILLGINAADLLIPASSNEFILNIRDAITTTTAFITSIETDLLLRQTGTTRLYQTVIHTEIERMISQINKLTEAQRGITSQPSSFLIEATRELTEFDTIIRQTIAAMTPAPVVVQQPPVEDKRIEELRRFIQRQETLAESEKTGLRFFEKMRHQHTREQKIATARHALDALLAHRELPDDEILKKNKHLKEIISPSVHA